MSSGQDLLRRCESQFKAQRGSWASEEAIKNSIIKISIKILCTFFFVFLYSHCDFTPNFELQVCSYKNIVIAYIVGCGIAKGLVVSRLFIFNRLVM